jgi:hypothetical protein
MKAGRLATFLSRVPLVGKKSFVFNTNRLGRANCVMIGSPYITTKKGKNMKSIKMFSRFALIAGAVSLLSISAAAQEKKITAKQVPAAVISAFKSSYPNATIRGYAREKEDGKVFYEIESLEGTMHRDVLYNADGTVAEVEESIAVTDLPAGAQQAIKQKYPRGVIILAEKTTVGDTVGYEVSLRNGRKRIAMEFDASGLVKTKGK